MKEQITGGYAAVVGHEGHGVDVAVGSAHGVIDAISRRVGERLSVNMGTTCDFGEKVVDDVEQGIDRVEAGRRPGVDGGNALGAALRLSLGREFTGAEEVGGRS